MERGNNMAKTTTRSIRNNSRAPALSSEEKENRLIALAWDEAEKRLLDGTASNQLICQLIKVGSTRERLEKDILRQQKDLMEAKTDAIKSAKHVEELYANALSAMQSYSGQPVEVDEEDLY